MTANPKSRQPEPLRPVDPAPPVVSLTPTVLLALQAFEAAYRLGSFRAAAEALRLTPSAVSHRIRRLEAMVGHALFVRAHRTATPTPLGHALATVTGKAFADLARAAAAAEAQEAQARLRVAVVPTFATTWLIPRLAAFTAAHPAVELVIESVTRAIDFDNEPFDAAICSGEDNWPGLTAAELMRIQVSPICTPRLADALRLTTPADLARATLIGVTTFPLAWPAWFEAAGAPNLKPSRAIWFDSFGAAQEAAESGVGVALGLHPLFVGREGDGALCQPIPIPLASGSYWLVHRPADERSPALRVFKRWLQAEARR
jgi:DNA-binding transcriptional LysR family regulator